MSEDPVRTFLISRGSPEEVVAGGLDGLLERWEGVVEETARGYPLGLDDWLNDMDGRQLLEEAFAAAPEPQRGAAAGRLESLDLRFQALTSLSGSCRWGGGLEAANEWNPQDHWWYYRLPLNPGAELSEDLRSM